MIIQVVFDVAMGFFQEGVNVILFAVSQIYPFVMLDLLSLYIFSHLEIIEMVFVHDGEYTVDAEGVFDFRIFEHIHTAEVEVALAFRRVLSLLEDVNDVAAASIRPPYSPHFC